MVRKTRIPRRIKEVFPSNHNPEKWLLIDEKEFYVLVEHKTLGVKMRFDKFSRAYV